MDIPPPPTPPGMPTLVSLQQQTQNIYNLVNPGAIVPAACAAAYSADKWKCLFGAGARAVESLRGACVSSAARALFGLEPTVVGI